MKLILSVICLVLALSEVGCMTNSSGQKMEAAEVNSIRKGVTTRAEVERKFGPPIATSMLPDGRRVLNFVFSESTMKGTSFIPFHSTGVDMRRQSLQVIVGADNIVKDYEFNDTSGETNVGPLGVGGTHTERPTEPTPAR
jgi:outer membrane protein assembly factor BamE (lipoprotein component of BamABCDE complex)